MDMEKYDYRKIIPDLLQWYDENKRSMPWREEKNPYYTWVSEIMLQQTRVEAVKEYFLRFIGALPEVRDLAYAPEEQLLKLWEGLGYYNRVRNLSVAAKTIVEEKGGNFPDTYEEILELKGVGSYTAGAIASIAFGEQVPAVDGNVLRVMKRLAGSYDDIQKAKTKKNMEEQLKPIIPKRAGDFNQAIMDLGAMICIPNGRPLCEECPLAKHCQAKKLGLQQELPVKTKKKGRRIEEKTVLLLECQGEYALHKRGNTGILAGLWELPNLEGNYTKEEIVEILEEYENIIEMTELGPGKHIFSHIEWHMQGYKIVLKNKIKTQEYVWVNSEECRENYAIPTAFSQYTKRIFQVS